MNDLEYRRKALVRDIVDNPLFNEVVGELKHGLAVGMLECNDEDRRNEIYYTAKCLDLLVGSLTKIANEVRMTNAA